MKKYSCHGKVSEGGVFFMFTCILVMEQSGLWIIIWIIVWIMDFNPDYNPDYSLDYSRDYGL